MGKKQKKSKQKKKYSQLNGNDKQKSPEKRRSKRLATQKKDDDMTADDYQFRQSVEEDGHRTIIEMSADGNCLFRSISDQLYNDYGNMHEEVRNDVCDYIETNEDEFAVFLVLDETEEDEDAADFEGYCNLMREDGAWGGNIELVAAARLYRRNITVFSAVAAFTIEHGSRKSSGPEFLLSYHDNDHYNSIRDDTRPWTRFSKESLREEGGEERTERQNGKKEKQNTKGPDAIDDASTSETNESQKKNPTPSLKPNDACICGSGLRYKKCCLPAIKRKQRLQKWKEKNGIEESEDADVSVDEALADGKLKVLSI